MGMIGTRTGVGKRPHRVLFQDPGPGVSDDDGGVTQTWFHLSPPRMNVEIKPATARDLERIAAGTVLSTASHIVTGPYHAGVSTQTRIVFGTRVFSVTGVANPEERRIESIYVCVELLGALPLMLPPAAFQDTAFQHSAFQVGA
jgi:head-tail adaptor